MVSTFAPLVVVYGLSVVALGIAASRAFLPWLPDEAQYAIVAENLATAGTYRYRGDFPLLVQPLYPLLLAGARVVFGRPPEIYAPFLNAALMAAAIFPAYGIGRTLLLDRRGAFLLALAAAWIPNVWLATRYMAESVHYPLFLLNVFLALRILGSSAASLSIAGGLAVALSLHAKDSAVTLWLAWFCYAVLSGGMARWSRSDTERKTADTRARAAALVVVTSAMLCSPWILARTSHLGFSPAALLVSYRATPDPQFMALDGVIWWFRHLAYLLFAAGLITLVPFVVGLRSLWSDSVRRHQAAFLGVLVVILSLSAALFNRYQLGRLDDRYMFPLVPLILALALKGMNNEWPRRRWQLAGALLAAFGTLAVVVWELRGHGPSLLTPLAFGITRWTQWAPMDDVQALAFVAAFFLSLLLWRLSRLRPPIRHHVAAGSLALAFGIASAGLLMRLAEWRVNDETRRVRDPDLAGWLVHAIGPGEKLLVLGPRAAFQPVNPTLEADSKVRYWNQSFGIRESEIWRAEARARYDVRMVPRVELLPDFVPDGDARYLLSVVPFEGLTPIDGFGLTRLYRLDASDFREHRVRPRGDVHFLLEELDSVVGEWVYDRTFNVHGWRSTDRPGVLATTRELALETGAYSLRLCWRGLDRRWSATAQVEGPSGTLLSQSVGSRSPSLVGHFAVGPDGGERLRVIVHEGRVVFCGALLERSESLPDDGAPPAM